MVNQILVPQAKYELLSDVRQTRWKNQVVCLVLSLVVVGSLFATSLRFNIIDSNESSLSLSSSSSSPPSTSEASTSSYRVRDQSGNRDAEIASWLRRARMYAESTKENQNADRNATIADKRKQFDRSGPTSQIVVCYYTIPRDLNSTRELRPSHIDPSICTHLIVGFASVVNSTISLDEDTWSIYESVARLKIREPKLKVMLSAGGMDELQGGFPEMVKNHSNRKRFIGSVLELLKKLNFDGLDIDWEFPAWLGADERQKIYFVQLLQELRKEFDRLDNGEGARRGRLLLSIAVAAPSAIVDQSYNVPQIAEHVDFVNLMSYDYHFYVWYYPITGHNSPLYPGVADSGYGATLNVNYSAMYWLAKGMPREKLLIGVPTYGHNYELDNPANHDLSAPAKGFGQLGIAGFVPYPSICSFLAIGATRCFDRESKVPYVYQRNEWISYEDSASLVLKAEWIKANGFGGAMIFSLNDDDWNASCPTRISNETFPLTRTVVDTLRGNRYISKQPIN